MVLRLKKTPHPFTVHFIIRFIMGYLFLLIYLFIFIYSEPCCCFGET